MPGFGGGVARALGSDDVNVTAKVKNPRLKSAIDQALSDYTGYTRDEQGALSSYINKYLSQQGQFEKDIGQERDAVSQFYNGALANQLADLRGRRATAIGNAADVATRQALAQVNRSRLGSEGGGSSYDRRLAMAATLPIRTQAALDLANQERADLGYLTENQLGLSGRRASLSNALASYGLAPYRAAADISGRNIQQLGGITNLDQANTFYGLKKDKNTFADIADSLDAGILSVASIYGSAAGGGGMRRGGLVWPMNYDDGGMIHGPGTTHSDSILIRASKGEYVMPASSVRLPGVLPLLQRLRAAGLATEGIAHPLAMDIQMDRAGGWRAPRPRYWHGGIIPGYDEGGSVDWWPMDLGDDFAGGPEYGGSGSGWTMPENNRRSGGGGGYGGGLSGEAMQLRDRAAQDQNWAFQPATFVPQGGGWGVPAPVMPQGAPRRMGAPRMPTATFDYAQNFMDLYGPDAVPSNFGDLPPTQQREYIDMYSRARAMERSWGGKNPYE